MTSVNGGGYGIGEEKPIDAFNVSEGQDALDLASEDSFQSVGSPSKSIPEDSFKSLELPSKSVESVNSSSLETTLLSMSGTSPLPSPDSAIGGTPGLSPDSESLPDQYHTPIGKIPGMNRTSGQEVAGKPQQSKENSRVDLVGDLKTDDTTEGEDDVKVSSPSTKVTPVEEDKDDDGYEEDQEDEDDDCEVLSDSEMVVQASMMFPLAKKQTDQENPKEEIKDKTPVPGEANNGAEPISEVAVQMNVQVTQAAAKENTPSGCESDIEDNDEDDGVEDLMEGPEICKGNILASTSNRKTPDSLQLPETVVRLETPHGSTVFLVGTAHFSQESQNDVATTIRAVKPNIVVVELCKARTAILQLDEETILEESRSLDFKKVQMILRQHGKVQGMLYLLLLSVSAHITKQLGMAPGGEFRTAFAEVKARRSAPGCIIQFGDRPIQITLSRALASLSLWHKIKLTWHILTSKEPISKEEVEKCKQLDFIQEMLAEMTGQFPAISEVFVKERDIYLCRSLQAAAQPVPNPMSPTGMAPRVVVGVVGIGHVPGIVQRWGTVTDEDIPPIMVIPPTSLSTRILKVTMKLSFYGLLGFGAYKCLPTSTKASIHTLFTSLADNVQQKWLK